MSHEHQSSLVPPRDIRECRELARYRAKLVAMRSSERNRYQNRVTVPDIGLGSVLSDSMGVTARAVMADVASGEPFDEDRVRALVRGRARAKADIVVDAVRGRGVDGLVGFEPRPELGLAGGDQLVEVVHVLRRGGHLEALGAAVELAQTIPGVRELSAMPVISETGDDMSVFEDADHLASWAGLAPGRDESAGKKRSSRTTKAGRYLKPVLIQCALAAVRPKEDGYFASKYEGIARRRGKKRALLAVARMMMVSLYHMLSNGEVFEPADHDRPAGAASGRDALTEQSALDLLRSLGYDITAPTSDG